MTVRVVLAKRAETQLDVIDSWWRANRPRSPDLFIEEFLATVDLLSVLPDCGRKYIDTEKLVVRRSLLRASRYHVYYQHRDDQVIIVAIWSALRKTGPSIPDLLR